MTGLYAVLVHPLPNCALLHVFHLVQQPLGRRAIRARLEAEALEVERRQNQPAHPGAQPPPQLLDSPVDLAVELVSEESGVDETPPPARKLKAKTEFALRAAHTERKQALREWLCTEFLSNVPSNLFQGRLPTLPNDHSLHWILHGLPPWAKTKYHRACYPKTLSYTRKTLKCRHSLEEVKAEIRTMRVARDRVQYILGPRRREVAALIAPHDPHMYQWPTMEAVEIKLARDAQADAQTDA